MLTSVGWLLFFAISFVATVIPVVLVNLLWPLLRERRAARGRAAIRARLATVRATRIADVVDGEVVKLRGVVRLTHEALTAFLTGRRCVYYRAKLDLDNLLRAYVIEDVRSVDFGVEDESGSALVRGVDAHYAIEVEASPFDAATGAMAMKEAAILPDTIVEVLGRARWEVAPDGPEINSADPRSAPRRLVITPIAHQPVLVWGRSSET